MIISPGGRGKAGEETRRLTRGGIGESTHWSVLNRVVRYLRNHRIVTRISAPWDGLGGYPPSRELFARGASPVTDRGITRGGRFPGQESLPRTGDLKLTGRKCAGEFRK